MISSTLMTITINHCSSNSSSKSDINRPSGSHVTLVHFRGVLRNLCEDGCITWNCLCHYFKAILNSSGKSQESCFQINVIYNFLLQIPGEKLRFNDGDIIYEYNNESVPLGEGGFGTVFKGEILSFFHLNMISSNFSKCSSN